jgi:transposase
MERKSKRRRHSREFKLEAVKRSNEPGKTVAQVARELDLNENALHEWRRESVQKGENVFPGAGRKTPGNSSELEQLKRENARLREERDILKKSAIYFAKELKNDSGS